MRVIVAAIGTALHNSMGSEEQRWKLRGYMQVIVVIAGFEMCL